MTYEEFKPLTLEEQEAYALGWYRDAWGLWVHRNAPDGDGYEFATEAKRAPAPPSGG